MFINLSRCPPHIKEKAYLTYTRPILEYASSVWNPHTKKSISKIEQVQRRGIRFVLNRRGRLDSPSCMLKERGWQTLKSRRQVEDIVKLQKAICDEITIPIHDMLIQDTTTTGLRHRKNRLNFHMPQSNINAFKYCFPNRCISTWNNLDENATKEPLRQSIACALNK